MCLCDENREGRRVSRVRGVPQEGTLTNKKGRVPSVLAFGESERAGDQREDLWSVAPRAGWPSLKGLTCVEGTLRRLQCGEATAKRRADAVCQNRLCGQRGSWVPRRHPVRGRVSSRGLFFQLAQVFEIDPSRVQLLPPGHLLLAQAVGQHAFGHAQVVRYLGDRLARPPDYAYRTHPRRPGRASSASLASLASNSPYAPSATRRRRR